MDSKDRTNLDNYGVNSPEQKAADLEVEAQLWKILGDHPENQEAHKTYVGHVLRTGLLLEASRRYRPMIEDSETFSIETRRLARYYQKQIVNLLFMTPGGPKVERRKPTAEYIITFVAMMFLIIGFLDFDFWYLSVAALCFLAPFIVFKIREHDKIKEQRNKQGPDSGITRF
jgi:hypothetical protein